MMECPNCQAENKDSSRFCSNCATPLNPGEKLPVGHTKTISTPVPVHLQGSLIAGKYRIVKEIGRGGMGIVYKAEDMKLKRMVALKFLPPNLADLAELKDRFLIEAQAAAALSHANICVIHEVGESEERPFIAMEYVEGETLRALTKKQAMKTEQAVTIAVQLAAGLEEAHRKGIVHRDIKSANIMVTPKGQAKIMDFGLAKLQEGSGLTKSQTTMGTVAYMSPEQARGEKVDNRTDIWSLGVVFYEMLTGEMPFTGDREASVLYAVVHEEPRSLKDIKRDLPLELQQIINRALKKRTESRYASTAEMLADLKKYQDIQRAEGMGAFNLPSLLRRIRRPRVAIPAVVVVLLIAIAAFWFFNRQAKIRWAREEILPKAAQLMEASFADMTEPYALAETAEKVIPNDPKLAELFAKCSLQINVKTDPPGAAVYIKLYKSPESEWEYLGVSPMENVRLPIGFFRWKIEKEGYETVYAASSSWDVALVPKDQFVPSDLVRVLDEKGSIPEDMVRVKGAQTPVGELPDFFIDRYEVTNKQYKEFVNDGGYSKREYWKHEFVNEGKVLTWEEAMATFVDQTDRPGPASWQAGDYPEGQDNYPVSGISWYEAAAFAEYAGKSLPTGHHWGVARGEYTPMIMWPQAGGYAIFAPFSNFQGKGPGPVGVLSGITSYGALDMPGNVREWCYNKSPKGRMIRGGAWNDNVYQFGHLAQADAMDRSLKNGFRCALYPDPDKVPEAAFQTMDYEIHFDVYQQKPVTDEIFQIYKEQFSYDKSELHAQVEARDESTQDWIKERVSFDAAYGSERVIGILFLPKNTEPPYQTVIYWPGEQAFPRARSDNLDKDMEFQVFLSFIVKNGRAALYPVYKGTMERSNNSLVQLMFGDDYSTHLYTEYMVQLGKDFKRCIDYLETRPDIDGTKLAYYGMSWGASLGPIILAIEDRLQAGILLSGGFFLNIKRPRQEVDEINYVTRVEIPTLMINGKYDSFFPLEKAILPMYELLGTPEEQKDLKLYESDHIPPRNEFIKEILAWLDRYLGPVQR